jgi:peptide/nickel transport system substrate-binding protein
MAYRCMSTNEAGVNGRGLPRRVPNRILTAAGCALLLSVSACRDPEASASDAKAASPTTGGEITVAIRDDPSSLNPYVGRGTSVLETITHLVHAPLVRIDRVTGNVEPWLAERWSRSEDGLVWTVTLRQGIKFSDGVPLTSADVLFAFAAVYSPDAVSAIGDSMLIDGRQIRVSAPNPSTVVLTFPARVGAGLQVLDNLPILPRHRLATALRSRNLRDAWTLRTPPSDIVGLGPFRLVSYEPSEELVLERNPFYWRRDGNGRHLPILDRLRLRIVRDQSAEILRIENGQIDIGAREIRPEDYAPARKAEAKRQIQLADAGVSLDPSMLWFNLSPEAYAGDSRKGWLQSEVFRRALSLGVDRGAIVDQVYLGAAVPVFGVVSPGNRRWYAPEPVDPFDPTRARALLATIGLQDRDGDGILDDEGRRPVRFSILTLQQDTLRMRTVAVIQSQLRRLGVMVDIVGTDTGAIVQRWAAGRYDAIYFGVEATSYDPASNLDFWLSSGSFHVWNAEQDTPVSEWERSVDELMRQLVASPDDSERQRLFREVMRLHAEHLPVICFVAPRLTIAMSPRVANVTPAPLAPPILWNAEHLAVRK